MTKKDITSEFNKLKPFGFEVITYNDSRPLRKQQSNFVDHLIFNGKYIVFVEVKIGRDKLSISQERTAIKLLQCSEHNKYVFYKTVFTLAEARGIIKNLLAETL